MSEPARVPAHSPAGRVAPRRPQMHVPGVSVSSSEMTPMTDAHLVSSPLNALGRTSSDSRLTPQTPDRGEATRPSPTTTATAASVDEVQLTLAESTTAPPALPPPIETPSPALPASPSPGPSPSPPPAAVAGRRPLPVAVNPGARSPASTTKRAAYVPSTSVTSKPAAPVKAVAPVRAAAPVKAAAPAAAPAKASAPRPTPASSPLRSSPEPEKPLTWKEHLRRIFISLRFSFLFLVISSLVVVAVLSWKLTLDAANSSLDLVTSDYSTVLTSQITTNLELRLSAAEHVTAVNKQFFATDLLSFDRRDQMMKAFFVEVREWVSDTVSSVTMTSTAGEDNGYGYYFPTDGDAYMNQWVTIKGHYTQTTVINTETGELGNVTDSSDDFDATDQAWYYCVNTSDPNSAGWTPPYLFYGGYFISHSRTLLNSSGDLIGVATIDMQLGFIDTIAKSLAEASSVGTVLVILDAPTGQILGTSLEDFALTGDNDTGVYLEDGPALFQGLREFIIEKNDLSSTSPDYTNLVNVSDEVSIDGSELLVTVHTFAHITEVNPDYSIHWVLIHAIDRSLIDTEIKTSNKRVLISVVCICIAFVLVMSGLLWYSMRLISHLSVVLTSFARFEFRAHVEGGDLKSKSVFSELREMQAAVLEMTRSFKRHLDAKHQFFAKSSSGDGTGAGGGGGSSHYQPSSAPYSTNSRIASERERG